MPPDITRTIAESAGFIPQVWAQTALEVLRANIVLAMIVARDTDFEPQPQGKTLTIPFPGAFTASKKAEGSNTTTQTPTGGTSVSVTLSELAYVDFIVQDWATVQATPHLLMRYVEPAAVALAEQIETDLFTLYSSLTGGSVGTSGTDLTPAVLRTARKTLNDAKAPQSNRYIIFSTKDEIALLGHADLQNYFAFSKPENIEKGSLGPPIYGFVPFMSQKVPVVTGTPNSTKNLAIHKNAMLLATRPLNNPEQDSGVQATTIVDEMSGIAIRVLKQYDMNARGHRIGFDVLYGFTALRPTLGVVALS